MSEQTYRLEEPEHEEPTQDTQASEPVAAAPEPAAVVEEEVKPVPTVPLAALNEERHKQRELRAQLAELNKRLEGTEQLKSEIAEWRKAQQQATQTTDFQKDPLGGLLEEIRALKATQENAVNETRQQAQQREQMEYFSRTVASQVQEFQKATPDYPDALQFVIETRRRELQAMGTPDSVIDQAIDQESIGLAQTAIQRGMNPGELVYNLAKARGFAGKKVEAVSTDSKLDTIEKGQKAAQTLSEGGGSAAVIGLAKDIARMTDAEFADWEANSPDSPWYKPKKGKS